MIQVTQNVYVESGIKACNLGLITTKEGIVLVDVPIGPSDAVKWREEALKRGGIYAISSTRKSMLTIPRTASFSPECLLPLNQPGKGWRRSLPMRSSKGFSG